jgi:hypothetical protein
VQRDRRVVTRSRRPLAGCYLPGRVEPCGALPRKCLFIYFQPKPAISGSSVTATKDNNNRFTWSGPSGGCGCTGQAPFGPHTLSGDGCHAVPLNLLNRRTTRRPPRRKKITTQVLEWLPVATHVSVCPEPPPVASFQLCSHDSLWILLGTHVLWIG